MKRKREELETMMSDEDTVFFFSFSSRSSRRLIALLPYRPHLLLPIGEKRKELTAEPEKRKSIGLNELWKWCFGRRGQQRPRFPSRAEPEGLNAVSSSNSGGHIVLAWAVELAYTTRIIKSWRCIASEL